MIAPFAMLAALPLARKYGMFWAEIPGHVRESYFDLKKFQWEKKNDNQSQSSIQGLPIRMFLVAPFILLVSCFSDGRSDRVFKFKKF